MGRETRQTTKLPFHGKPIKFYRPTDGQAAVMLMAVRSKGDGSTTVARFFQVLEALTVNPDDWSRMEEAMIAGTAVVKDFSDLIGTLFSYDWPEETPADDD